MSAEIPHRAGASGLRAFFLPLSVRSLSFSVSFSAFAGGKSLFHYCAVSPMIYLSVLNIGHLNLLPISERNRRDKTSSKGLEKHTDTCYTVNRRYLI